MTTILVIPNGDTAYTTELEADELAHLQRLVGGWIEQITVGKIVFTINEEGKLKPHQPAARATAFLKMMGLDLSPDYLTGVTVVSGHDGEGDLTSIPQAVLDAWDNVFERRPTS